VNSPSLVLVFQLINDEVVILTDVGHVGQLLNVPAVLNYLLFSFPLCHLQLVLSVLLLFLDLELALLFLADVRLS